MSQALDTRGIYVEAKQARRKRQPGLARSRARSRRRGIRAPGLHLTPEYSSWQNMKKRCLYPKATQYKDYGGRGIAVCDRWLGADGFEHFLSDMGPKPEPKSDYSIDRIDVDGNYEPSNCRWATRIEQVNNKRRKE